MVRRLVPGGNRIRTVGPTREKGKFPRFIFNSAPGPVPERREAKGHQQVLCSKLAPVGRRRGGAPRFTSSCSGRQATPCIRRPIRVERVAVVGSRPLPRELTGVFEDALVWERALEPVEKLGGRSDLVVVLAVWEERAQFVRIPRDLTPAQNRKWCRFSARAGAS
jgi:hypothetical protein